MSLWRDNYCLDNDYDSKMKLSIISLTYNITTIRCQIDRLNTSSCALTLSRTLVMAMGLRVPLWPMMGPGHRAL